MNMQQKNYIKKRIESMVSPKLMAISNECKTKGVTLSNKEIVDKIRSGDIKMLSASKLREKNLAYSLLVRNIFDVDKHEVKVSFNQEQFDKRKKKLMQAKDQLIDEIMLGDAEEAIAMLAKFEREVF